MNNTFYSMFNNYFIKEAANEPKPVDPGLMDALLGYFTKRRQAVSDRRELRRQYSNALRRGFEGTIDEFAGMRNQMLEARNPEAVVKEIVSTEKLHSSPLWRHRGKILLGGGALLGLGLLSKLNKVKNQVPDNYQSTSAYEYTLPQQTVYNNIPNNYYQ